MSGIRLVLHWACVALLAAGLCAPTASAIDLPDVIGPNQVGHTAYSIFDAARSGRELPLHIWYPADATAWTGGTFTFIELVAGAAGLTSTVAKDDVALPAAGNYPLIVFSHGFGGFNIQSISLMEHLASHGFVVVSPNHTGNTQDDMSSLDPEADRFPDVAFVIDEMAVANLDALSLFLGHVDATNVGVAGHSYGGMTSLFMASGYDGGAADSRVKAIVPVAPSTNQLSDAELQSITIPTTLVVGTKDGLRLSSVRAYSEISSSELILIQVRRANHTHFANVCDIADALINAGLAPEFWYLVGAAALVPIYFDTCVPPAFPIAEATRLQNLYAAATFRRYLLGETAYATYLTKAYADTEPDVSFFEWGPGLLPGTIPAMPRIAYGILVGGLVAASAVYLRRRQ
ncbi:MAG: alpha/beta fold hydrolase [Deltaproteobacteria bacterium]|nr:alpha/beta fold hydrolase [Deltaproteobacteria bacterium]